jgi:solute carrier family 25 protein 42
MTGHDLSNIERMQCGAISGLFAQSLTYPLEVTRRRMQTIGIVATSGKEAAVGALGTGSQKAPAAEAAIRLVTPEHPPTMATIVKELYAEQGIRGFFKGVSLNWFKGPIAFSISFTAFDIFQGFLETDLERIAKLPRRNTDET